MNMNKVLSIKYSIGYEDPGPLWSCNVMIISECVEEHAACYQKLEATGYFKTLVITCNTKLCHITQDQIFIFRTIQEFVMFLTLMLKQDVSLSAMWWP